MPNSHLLSRLADLPERGTDWLFLRLAASRKTWIVWPVLAFVFCAGASVWRAWGC